MARELGGARTVEYLARADLAARDLAADRVQSDVADFHVRRHLQVRRRARDPLGDRRLRRFIVEILLAAAAVTCVLAAVTGVGHVSRLGGWAVADVLAIAWARQFPDSALVFYGLLVLRGREIVRIICGAAIVLAIFIGPMHMAPELFACAAAAFYPTSRLRR